MRWDITGQDSAVRPVDWKQWDRIRAIMAPTVTVSSQVATAGRRQIGEGYRELPGFDGRNGTESHALGYDPADVQLARSLMAKRRPSAKYTKARGMTPCPVYVAQFDGGHEVRVSFWTREAKPVDFAQGYNVAMTLARDVPIGGRVEMADGTALADPHFAPKADLAAIAATVRLSAKDMRAALAAIAGLPCSDQAGTAYQAVTIARKVLGHDRQANA